MKTNRYIVLLFSFFFLVKNGTAQVKVKFHNKSGYTIDSLTLPNHYIGKIEKGQATDFISFPAFQSSFQVQGKIGGMKTEFLQFSCGTGIRTLTDTTVIYDLKLKSLGQDKYQLQVLYHQ
jgi:hypothetical protein